MSAGRARGEGGSTGVGARLLGLLHREPEVSGARLSAALGVSRAAVWKHVERLRALGYRIEARHARGYRLAAVPDRLLPAEIERRLATVRFGRPTVYRETTDSTNVEAARLARAGATEGTLVVAERQTRGRGRLGRRWISPPRVSLYASFVLRPPLAPAGAPQIALAAAVAVARALEPLAPGRVAIKWPNDCLLDGRKVAGILTEMAAEIDRVEWVVLGIGVNLNLPTGALPAEIRATATSVLQATGVRVDRVAFTAALCAEVEAVYDRLVQDGFGALLAEWESYSCLTGRTVAVDAPGGRVEGRVRGLDAGGRLVLDGPAGEQRVVAGDVTVVGGYAAAGAPPARGGGARGGCA
jgi:BirA family biotin operon repressor/biotin-[acetyl-CoA-carboxylase] ligase